MLVIETMGVATSKVEQGNGGSVSSKKELIIAGGRGGITGNKRRPRGRFDDCFGLDESQSRTTESTQGSPEIDMHPSKATRGARRSSLNSSTNSGLPKWFRRQSSANGLDSSSKQQAKNKINEPLPPSYLVFKTSRNSDESLPTLSSESSGKAVPVPVQGRKKTQSAKAAMGGWESPSAGDLGGDFETQMDELQRMYDMRTWDMYFRIMEARKSRPIPTMIPHQQELHPRPFHAARTDYDYSTPREEVLDDSDKLIDESQTEDMIFGDLE